MKKIFATLLAATALMACNKNETLPEAAQADDIVRFSSNLRTYTVKSATALDGKTVKIVAGAPINATTTAEAADNKLTPVTEMHWVKDQTSATTFTSVYPADIEMTAAGKVEEYNLLFEGNHDFDYHSAVLTAVAKDVTPNTTVNFEYKHPFAMLLVTVVNQLEGTPAITKVNVSDVIMDGSIDVAAGTVTPGTTAAAADAALKDGKYGVVILPQSAKPVLNITAGEKNYRFVLASAIDFQANKRYNATVTIKDSTPVVEEGEAVTFGFTVADWEDADDPLNYVDISEQWSVIGNIQGTNWDADFVMEEGETPGILEAEITYKAGEEFKLRKAAAWDISAGLKDGVATVGDAAWDGYLTTSDNNIKLAAAGVYTLTFNPATWAFTATKTGDVAADPDPETGTLILNVYNSAGWEDLRFYSWVEADPWPHFTADWPGTAPEAADVVTGGHNFKSFVVENVPLNADNLFYILSDNGNDARKTVNLKLPVVLTQAETTLYVELKTDKSVVVIEDPATFEPEEVAPVIGDIWVVVGIANSWTTEYEMTQDANDPNLWTVDITLGAQAAEEGGFKIRTKGDTEWTGHQFGGGLDANLELEVPDGQDSVTGMLTADNGGSKNIVVKPFARAYTFSLYVDGEHKGEFTATLK